MGPGVGWEQARPPVIAPTSQCFTFPLLGIIIIITYIKCSFYCMSMIEVLFSSHDLLEVVDGVQESEHSITINIVL